MNFLRVACCVFALTFTGAAHAQTYSFVLSEQQLLEAYDKAIAIVKAQKPILLTALQKEQADWRIFRDNECKESTDPDYCKTNMNRKRTRVLMGEHPSGKKQGTSF